MKKLCLYILFLLLTINFISAVDQVYFLQSTDVNGEMLIRPVEQKFVNSELSIGSQIKSVYLSKSADGRDAKDFLGDFQNVIIKKEGNNFKIEFKDKGSIRIEPSNKEYSLNNIKQGSTVTLNEKGEIISADIETLSSTTININNKVYDLPSKTKLKVDSVSTEIILGEKGSFSIYKESNPDEKTSYENIKQGGSFSFDENLNLIKAEFETASSMDFKYKGYSYKLPADTKVVIGEDKKVSLTLSDGTKLEEPKISSDADKEVVFSFSTKSGNEITLPNNEIIKNKNGKTIINYQEGFYLEERNYAILKNNNEELSIYNPDKLYLAFDESSMSDSKKSYLYLGSDKIISKSLNSEGAAININQGNRVGFAIDNDHTISIQAKNGIAVLERAAVSGEMPVAKISGNSLVNLDKRTIYADNNKIYFNNNARPLSDFNQGRFSTYTKISLIDNNENPLLPYDIYTNHLDQYAAVKKSDFKGPMDFYKTSGGFYISPKISFNLLTKEAQQFLDEEMDSDLLAEFNKLSTNEKANIAFLQIKINQLMSIPKIRFSELSLNEFQKKTGIRLTGALNYLTSQRLQTLMNFIQALPIDVVKSIKVINIAGLGGGGWSNGNMMNAYANQLDDIRKAFTITPGMRNGVGMSIGTYYHEAFHQHTFVLGNQFTNEWNSLLKVNVGTQRDAYNRNYYVTNQGLKLGSNPDFGYTYWYGTNNYMEDIATYGDFINYPEFWNPLISSNNPYATIYRGKLALLKKYNFITPKQYKNIFEKAGLDYSASSVNNYINAAKTRR